MLGPLTLRRKQRFEGFPVLVLPAARFEGLDRMFGTFQQEQAPVRFGLVNNVNTQNPFTITFMVWRAMWRDIRNSAGWNDRLGYVFGPPNWQPKKGEGDEPW